jgi:flagellar hook-associated protein 1
LVDSGGARPFPRTYDAAAGTVTDGSVTYPIRSGELSGLFTGLSQVQGQKAALDQLADSLRATFNPLHQTGVGSNGNTGLDFFNPIVPALPNGARSFDLGVDVKADPNAIAASTTGKPGDGGLALAFSQLRDDAVASLGGRTFADYFGLQVSTVAGQVSYFESALATEEAVQQQIQNQIQAVSGVSIDDEMADMMRFQRSYQAAAKALTIFDQVAEDLIGMLRR